MKVHLLYRDRDFDAAAALVWNQADLVRDLALERVFAAMADGDAFVDQIARRVLLGRPEMAVDTIGYRQDALQDCQGRPDTIRTLYALATEAVELERHHYLGTLSRYPAWVLSWALDLIGEYLGVIVKLRALVDREAAGFRSEAWTSLFRTLQTELGDDYLDEVREHLVDLKFGAGLTMSATLGPGAKGCDYRLHRTRTRTGRWWERWVPPRPGPYGFSIHPRDEAGASALQELRHRGVNSVADALGQSADHIRNFFIALRTELAFYVGCLNLHAALARRGCALVRPTPQPPAPAQLGVRGLRDVGLVLAADSPIVGNDLPEIHPQLVVVTGANQGGKSTFLRSVGLAQLMMQAGMSVAAEQFESSVCSGVFTQYKREEDASMSSGKLDEELKRMSDILDHLRDHALVLFNESFAATNEREGSEIARQVITGLVEHGHRVVCVTHLYAFAHALAGAPPASTAFLRADRNLDGTRSFKLSAGPPLETSFGDDLYLRIFGEAPTEPSNAEIAG